MDLRRPARGAAPMGGVQLARAAQCCTSVHMQMFIWVLITCESPCTSAGDTLAIARDNTTVGVHRNVLFMVVDDMRPAIGAYNFSLAYTPNLDRLAKEGLVFGRAYVQYAYCGPSRNR